MKYFEGLSNNFIGKLSEELCWEIVKQFTLDRPINCFRELFNKFTSEGCPQIKQIFLFGNDFHTWYKHV